ncbi:MAG: hypothetical protein GWO23_08850, partial [Gammaproteobacteria bacterium]|nr:hypothetical protein [Gammaproteobacteria bacterium]
WDGDGGLGGSLQYNADLFHVETIERMVGHFVSLLSEVAESPDEPICELNYLSQHEQEQQLIEWNLTERPYDRELTLDRALSNSLAAHSDSIA